MLSIFTEKDILIDALGITEPMINNPFLVQFEWFLQLSNMLRPLIGIPLYLRIRKTAGYDRPRHHVLQILWGIIHRSNIDYAERIWEEFVQSIQTFLTDRKNLTTASRGKKKTAHLLIPSVRFVGKDGREIFGMPIPDALLTDDIKGAPYYDEYLEHVAKYQQHLDAEHGMEDEGGATESPKATKVTKPKAAKTSDAPSSTKRAKAGKVTKKRMSKSSLQLVDEGVLEKEPAHDDEETDLQRALELSLKDQGEQTQGPACVVVIRETDYGRIQSLPDVQGKGKEKVVDEQAAYDLLTLHTPKQKSPVDQFIFQRRTPMPTESSGHAESPSLDAELALINSETESNEEASKIHAGDQDEGHVVHAGQNLGHMDSEATDASTQQKPKQMDEEFTTTAYPNVQENLKLPTKDQLFVEKPQEEEPEKTNTESEVQSMVMVPIHQDTSSVPPMTSPVIDLAMSRPVSTSVHAPLPTSTCIGELEQNMADLIQDNLALEESLDKHGTRLYNLENLNIPHKVSQAVDEIVTDAVDWAMQAPLRARFKDLPTVDMKEILQKWMFEDNSYKAHDVYNDLYEALQKSLELDYSNQRLAD
ncbi:retrovirus-related pol polyprotein from transposon TNT 1-94 [Tanacetum coccineum]